MKRALEHRYTAVFTYSRRTVEAPTQKWKKITQTHTMWFLKQVVTSSRTGNLRLYRKCGTEPNYITINTNAVKPSPPAVLTNIIYYK